MNEALLTGLITLAVCMINNHYQGKAVKARHDETISLIEYRLKQLEKKVDLHNNAVERLYNLEQKMAVVDEKIDVANHRIKDLEE